MPRSKEELLQKLNKLKNAASKVQTAAKNTTSTKTKRDDDDVDYGQRYADSMAGSSSRSRATTPSRDNDDYGRRYADMMNSAGTPQRSAAAPTNYRDKNTLMDRLARLQGIDVDVPSLVRSHLQKVTPSIETMWDYEMPTVNDQRRTLQPGDEGYTGSLQEVRDRIQTLNMKRDADKAMNAVNPRKEGDVLTDDDRSAAIAGINRKIWDAEATGADTAYINALYASRDRLISGEEIKYVEMYGEDDPLQNLPSNELRSREIGEDIARAEMELDRRADDYRYDQYEAINEGHWRRKAEEAAAAGWEFDELDLVDFRQAASDDKSIWQNLVEPITGEDPKMYWTLEQTSMYEYLRSTGQEDEAERYAEYIKSQAIERRNQIDEQTELDMGWNGAYRTIRAIAANPLKVINAVDIIAQNIQADSDVLYQPIVPDRYNRAGIIADTNLEYVTEQLDSLGTVNDMLRTVFNDEDISIPLVGDLTWGHAYGIGMDAVNAYVNSMLVGGSGFGTKLMMGLQKGSDEYIDAIDRESSNTRALLYAGVTGFNEGMWEGLSFDFAKHGVQKMSKALGVMGIIGLGLLEYAEGSAQEGLTSVSDFFADLLFNGDKSKYSLRVAELTNLGYSQMDAEKIASDEVGYEFLMSSLLGGFGQIGTMAAGVIPNRYISTYNTGATIRDLGNADLTAEFMSMVTGKDVKAPKGNAALGRMYNQIITKGSKIADRTARSAMDKAVMSNYDEAQAGIANTKVDVEYNERLRKALKKLGRGDKLTGRQEKLISGSDRAKATQEAIKSGDIEVDLTDVVMPRFAAQMAPMLKHYSMGNAKFTADDAKFTATIKTSGTTEAAKERAESRKGNMNIDATAENTTVSDETVTVQGIGKVIENEGEATVKVVDSMGNTKEVAMNEITFNDPHTYDVYAYAQDMATPELAQAFIDTVDSTTEPIEYVANGMQHAYDMALNGYTNIDTVRTSPLTTGISKQQLQTAFDMGVKDRAAQIAARAERARKRQQATADKRWQSGRIIMGDVVMDGLSEEQKRDLDIVDVIAKEFGINIELFESKADKDGNYQGERGSYDPKTNTIHLDVRAGVNKVGDSFAGTTMLKTVAHELTHSLQRNSPEQYEAYKNAVLDVLEKNGQDIEEMVDTRMAEDSSLTREAAIDEIVADASETMLRDSDLMDRLQELHPEEAKTFIQKVLDLLKRIKDAIREAFEGVELSKEAQAIMSDIDRLAAQWSDLAVEAAEVSGRSIEISPDVQQRINNDLAIDGIDEVKNSIRHDEKYMAAAVKRNRELGYITPEAMREAEKARATVRDFFRDPKNTELLKLPADVTGKTFYANSSYDGSEENTTVCIRSMAAQQLMDEVAKDLGRPLTVQDTLLISQEIASLTDRPECFYCYVATDRRAYREYLGDYLKQRDEVIRKYKGGADRASLYREFLDGRKPTQNMEDRFNMWLDAVDNGADLITGKDLASLEDLFAEIGGRKKKKKPTTSRLDQLQDAAAYAQSASWAKKMNGYAAYNNHILKWTQKRVDDLNKGYGLRMYSFSDYSPAFVLENMQMITDAAVRGLNVLAYTKEMDFAEIFAPSGANINISVFATEVNGQITSDAMQGADWARAQDLRSKFDNVGTVMVATNDRIMKWAMEQDWVDVVIPYHLVRTGKAVAKYFGYKDYTSVSADRKTLNYKEGDPTSVSPVEHHNDIVDYVNALQKYGLTPRFEDQIQGYVDFVAGDITPEQFREMNPYYMKLVNETRRSYADTKPVQPVFNTDAAMASIDTMIKQGGYYQPIGGSMEKQSDIAEEIAGKIRDEDSIRYSTRRSDNISDREILANVLEDAVQNEDERELIEEYRSKLGDLTENQKQLDAARATIRELAFKPRSEYAEGDLQRLETAREDAKRLANKLARADKRLLKMQAMTPVKNVLARARQQAEVKMRLRKDEQLRDYRSRREATQLRKTVIRKASNLDKLLRNPTDKRHLPEDLRKPVLDLMEAFTSMDDAFGGSQDALAKLSTCRRAYERMKLQVEKENGTSDYAASKYDDDIAIRMSMLEEVINANREGGMHELTADDLRKMSAIMDHFEFLVREGNKEIINGKRVETGRVLSNIFDQMYDESTGRPKYGAGKSIIQKMKWVGDTANGLHISNLTPVYFSRMMGGQLGELMDSIINADATFGLNYHRAQDRLAEIRDEFNYDSWAHNNKELLTITAENGAKLKLTREQALCIWATDKRERGSDIPTNHLALGGVIFDEKAAKSNFNGEVTETTGSPLNRETLTQINDWLTDEQKRYADAMVVFVSNDMARLGNETSMELHGYKKFREGGYYFPFRTPSDFIRKEAGRSIDVAMYKNEGFTKPLQKGASTPVLITDFSDAIANHVERMCKYNALAVPQDTLQRILNYKAEKNVSVESLIRGYYGSGDVVDYMRRFLSDIHDKGRGKPEAFETLGGKLASMNRRGSVLGSASVAIQQPSALPRAMAMINLRHFRKPAGSLKAFEEAKKYSGVCVLKDMGGFDAGTSVSSTDWLLGRSDQWIRKHGTKKDAAAQLLNKAVSIAPEIADKLTWGELWNTVKREQAYETGLDINSEELKQIAGKRMDEVCKRTQVYDSVMVKSQVMRNEGRLKQYTSFMAEPTVTYNMVADALRQGLSGHPKAMLGTMAAVVASIIYNNALKSIVLAGRDDDDEKAPWGERWFRNFMEGNINDIVILNYVPIARDVWSMLMGYDVERPDASVINKGLALIVAIADDNKSVDDKLYSASQVLGTLTPVPIGNIWRDLRAVKNTFFKSATSDNEWRDNWTKYAMRDAVTSNTPLYRYLGPSDAERLYNAALEGDDAAVAEQRQYMIDYKGKDDKKLNSTLKSSIKKGYINGDMDDEQAISMLTKYAGMAKSDATDSVLEWSYERETGVAYSDIKDAYLAGDITAEEAAAARVNYGGVDEDAAASTAQQWQYQKDTGIAYSDMKDEYIAGNISRREAEAARVKYGGQKEEDAAADVRKWDYEAKYGHPYSEMKDEYLAGNISRREAEAARVKYGGQKEEDAAADVRKWDYEAKYGHPYSEMKDEYLAGNIKSDTAVAARVKYGGAFESDAAAEVLKWDYEKETGIPYTEMKDEYLAGNITSKDAVAARIKYGGLEPDAAELDVSKWDYEAEYGHDYDDMDEYYKSGELTHDEAVAARVKYGGQDEAAAYFAVEGWEYTNSTGKEWHGKNTKVHAAIDAGDSRAMREAMQELYDHGGYDTPDKARQAITSSITSTYKPLYIAATPAQRTAMEEDLIDAYEMAYKLAGKQFSRSRQLKTIRKWLEND